MPAPELWPPLEEVRQWAAGKISNDQTLPVTTGKYKNLIALIDEILASKTETPASEEPPRPAEQQRRF